MRSGGSTPSSSSSVPDCSAPAAWPRRCAPCARTRRCTSRAGRRSRRPREQRSSARTPPSVTGSAGCRRRRARSSSCRRTRRSTRRSRTTASRRRDGSRPGQYYLNTYAPETRPRYEAETLAFHESVPGHHLQLAIMQEVDRAARRSGASTAARPTSRAGASTPSACSEEMGLLSSEIDRFGVLSFDAWRASRLVVDTGMHALGWTRQQAIDFMVEHTALGENNIANEVDRYISYARSGAGLQARPARDPAAAIGGARAPGGPLRHQALPRRRPRAGRPAAARPARGRGAHAHLDRWSTVGIRSGSSRCSPTRIRTS